VLLHARAGGKESFVLQLSREWKKDGDAAAHVLRGVVEGRSVQEEDLAPPTASAVTMPPRPGTTCAVTSPLASAMVSWAKAAILSLPASEGAGRDEPRVLG
jgi:hypothetical protein